MKDATGAAGGTRRARSASSRPAASRPGTAPAASATGVARRAGRGAAGRKPAQGKTFLPQSILARQVAILGLVLCAIALSVAFPLRGYLEQRAELAAAVSAQQELEQREAELQARKAALQDPEYVAAEARRRLQLVLPGDTVYVVHAPATESEPVAPVARPADDAPWYSSLWRTLSEGG